MLEVTTYYKIWIDYDETYASLYVCFINNYLKN